MKKLLILLISIFVIISLTIVFINLQTTKEKGNYKNENNVNEIHVDENSAATIFGNDYCNTNHDLEIAGSAFTNWTCKLCGKKATNPDTNVPELCNNCASLTGRCSQCGKLKK